MRSIQFNLSRKYKLKFFFINGIRTFELKYTLFKLVFEVNGLEERCSWTKGFLEDKPNSIWIVLYVCLMISEGFIKGVIGLEFTKSFNSHWQPWVISFHFNFLGTKVFIFLGLYCKNNVHLLQLTYNSWI